MKKLFLVVLALIIIFNAFWPCIAYADDDDFEVEYEFVPARTGCDGGKVQLRLTVRNTGPTDITWIEAVINTETPYSERWESTPIHPGTTRTITFTDVIFSTDDVNTEKLLAVSMNNNISANPDGIKLIPFTLRGTYNMYSISASISPEREEYRPGDTVTISYRIKNEMEAVTLMHMKTRPMLTGGPGILLITQYEDLGNVFPGATKSNSFTYTFEDDYAGEVYLTCMQEFTLLEVVYRMSSSLLTFQVAGPEISFTAALYADETEVDAGDSVTLRIAIGNTGDDAIDTFEVLRGGALEASAESLPAGGSGSVTLTKTVHETTTFRYAVLGKTGSFTDTVETNAVTVRVREPEASATPAAATKTPDAPAITETAESGSAASAESVTDAAVSEATQPASSEAGTPGILYLLIAILALVIIAGIVVIVILTGRKKE